MTKFSFQKKPSKNYEMATIMVRQWKDDRLKSATGRDLVLAYGVSLVEAEGILKEELKKRNWI